MSTLTRHLSTTSHLLASQDPEQVYQSLLDSGELSSDKHQAKVVASFQALHAKLRDYCPPEPQSAGSSILSNTLGRIFGSSFSGQEPNVASPKGVYLWGTVGGGKTMLMDMFYDTVEAADGRKARVHYHDFMQDVHKLMHETKKAAPPRDLNRLPMPFACHSLFVLIFCVVFTVDGTPTRGLTRFHPWATTCSLATTCCAWTSSR